MNNNTSVNVPIYSTFNKASRRSRRSGRNRSNQQRNPLPSFDAEIFMDNICSPPFINQQYYINFVRSKITNLNKHNTKMLFLHLCKCINEQNPSYHKYNSNRFTAYLTYLF